MYEIKDLLRMVAICLILGIIAFVSVGCSRDSYITQTTTIGDGNATDDAVVDPTPTPTPTVGGV